MLAQIALGTWLALAACRQETRPARYDGLVVEMQAASILQIASFTLRTDDGTLVEMIVEGDVGMTSSHLREHMALADPVAVTVRYADGLIIATRIEDLLPPGPPKPTTVHSQVRPVQPAQPHAIREIAAWISSAVAIPSYRSTIVPLRSTKKIHGSLGSRHSVTASARI